MGLWETDAERLSQKLTSSLEVGAVGGEQWAVLISRPVKKLGSSTGEYCIIRKFSGVYPQFLGWNL